MSVDKKIVSFFKDVEKVPSCFSGILNILGIHNAETLRREYKVKKEEKHEERIEERIEERTEATETNGRPLVSHHCHHSLPFH